MQIGALLRESHQGSNAKIIAELLSPLKASSTNLPPPTISTREIRERIDRSGPVGSPAHSEAVTAGLGLEARKLWTHEGGFNGTPEEFGDAVLKLAGEYKGLGL